jgi:predicted small integral membrane protein
MNSAGFLIATPADDVGGEQSLPFRPQNRMTTFLVTAVLILCGMCIWGVKVIATTPNPQSTPAYAFLGISVALALKMLLSLLATEFARRDILADNRKTRHDLRGEMNAQSLKMDEVVKKTNGGLSHAVAVAGEQVRKAEHSQMLDDPEFRQRLVADLCPMLGEDVAKRVVEMLKNPPQ